MNPILSIAIPTFNRAHELTLNLDEIIFQIEENNFQNTVEIIISDNASIDKTNIFLKPYLEKYNYIKYLKNSENLGIDKNVFNAINLSSGVYVWLLGDDDLLAKNSLYNVMTQVSNAIKLSLGLIVLNYEIYDSDLNERLHGQVSDFKTGVYFDDKTFLSNIVFLLTFISIVIIKRCPVLLESKKINSYNNSLHLHYYMAIYLAINYGFCFLSIPAIKFRSGRSDLGADFQVALTPYEILFSERHDLNLKPAYLKIASKNAFKSHVFPWLFLAKLKNKLTFTHLYLCLSKYWKEPKLWIIVLPLLFTPQVFLNFARKFRKYIL